MGKDILINQLFAGAYPEEGSNIGHEIINFFKADDGKHYVYVTPSGKVPPYYDLDSIVFVLRVSEKTARILAVASGLHAVNPEESKDVSYGGVPVTRIFHDNTHHGKRDSFNQGVAYWADIVTVPDCSPAPILTIDDSFVNSNAIRLQTCADKICNRKFRKYFNAETDRDAFNQLKRLSNGQEGWLVLKDNAMLVSDDPSAEQKSILEILRKEDDELAYSNLLAHYFQLNHEVFQKFAQECLSIDAMDREFEISREAKIAKSSNSRVDILIESDDHVIVIENKINSDINSIKQDGDNQLDDYFNAACAGFGRPQVKKQLHFFLFAPDNSPIRLTSKNVKEGYQILRYSAIHKFFVEHKGEFKNAKYFEDFIYELRRQTLSSAERSQEKMRSRFLEKINAIKSNC